MNLLPWLKIDAKEVSIFFFDWLNAESSNMCACVMDAKFGPNLHRISLPQKAR